MLHRRIINSLCKTKHMRLLHLNSKWLYGNGAFRILSSKWKNVEWIYIFQSVYLQYTNFTSCVECCHRYHIISYEKSQKFAHTIYVLNSTTLLTTHSIAMTFSFCSSFCNLYFFLFFFRHLQQSIKSLVYTFSSSVSFQFFFYHSIYSYDKLIFFRK